MDEKYSKTNFPLVSDIVSGYIMLAEQLKKKNLAGAAFNFSDENPDAHN